MRAARRAQGRLGLVGGRDRAWWLGGDALALLALTALTCLVWLPAFGTPWVFVAALGGCAIGCAVAVAAVLRRWGPLTILGVSYLALLLLGTPLVAPGLGLGGVLPTLASLRGLAGAPVTVWRSMLTIAPPLGETGVLLAGPFLVGQASGLLGMLASAKGERPTLAWVPAAVGLVVAGLFGGASVALPVVAGAGFLAVVMVWTAWRRRVLASARVASRASVDWRAVLGGAALLAGGGLVAGLAAPVVAPTHRAHLRESVSPPFDPYEWSSPLQGFRRNMADDRSTVLLHLSGLPEGARVRLATMDAWDGLTARVTDARRGTADTGQFRRVGAQVPGTTTGKAATVDVEIKGLDGVWLPTVGAMRSVRSPEDRRLVDDLYYNPANGTGVVTSGVREGDRYQLQVVVPPTPARDRVRQARAAQVSLPPMEPIPNQLRDLAATWTKDAVAAGDIALTLQEKLQLGYYSNGGEKEQRSLPGHHQARLAELVRTDRPMVGDEEQYAVAMAVMARSLGLPSRVVYGYRPAAAGEVDVLGSMASAWVEIDLEGLGWTVFDPTPAKDRTTNEEPVLQPNRPRPQVDNPPPPPQRPERAPLDQSSPVRQNRTADKGLQIPWEQVGQVALYAGLPLLLLVAPVALVLGAKLRRRRHRRFAPDPRLRIAGGWSELVDRARDLGSAPAVGDTRSEQAEHLVASFDQLGGRIDAADLARKADASVFAPDAVADDAADDYWGSVEQGLKGMGASRGRWRRIRAALSLRSLRRHR